MIRSVSLDVASHNDRKAFDDLVALVERGAAESCGATACAIAPILRQCVEQSVASLWPSPIRTFVPLLALRAVRECCRNGTCPDISSANPFR